MLIQRVVRSGSIHTCLSVCFFGAVGYYYKQIAYETALLTSDRESGVALLQRSPSPALFQDPFRKLVFSLYRSSIFVLKSI